MRSQSPVIVLPLHHSWGDTRCEEDRIAVGGSIRGKGGLRIIPEQKRDAEPYITDPVLGAVESRDQRMIMAHDRFPGEKVCVGDKLRKRRPVFSRVPAFPANGHFHGTTAYNLGFEPFTGTPGHILVAFSVHHHRQILHGHGRGQNDVIGGE